MSRVIARCAAVLILASLLGISVSAALGANLLANPGFETWPNVRYGDNEGSPTQVESSWSLWFPSGGMYATHELEPNRAPGFPHGGLDASCHGSSGENGECYMFQIIPVLPNQPYTASAWIRTVGAFAASDTASLWVQELSADETTTTFDHGEMPISGPSDTYVQKSVSFSTQSNTAKIRFMLHSKIAANWTQARTIYDDCVLDGPSPTFTLSGTVTSGGSPLEGVTVTIGSATATTGADGKYTFDPMPVVAAEQIVKAAKEGYISENKYRTIPQGAATVDFDLVLAPASNLLANPGFETWPNVKNGSYEANQTQFESGWRLWFPTECCYATHEMEWVRAPGYKHGGNDASTHGGCGANGECYMYQEIPVVPGTPYRAGAFIKGHAGFKVTDTASLWIQEINEDGTVITFDHGEMPVSGATQDFVYKGFSFTPQAGTAKVRFMLHSKLADNWTVTRAIYDDCFLEGAVPTVTLKGTVTGGGSPLEGVTLTWGTATETTGADGKYQFDPAPVVPAEQKITAGKAGFFSENKYRVLPSGEYTLNYDLVQLPASNLLANPGFDTWPSTLGANTGQSLNNGWMCKWYGPAWSYFAHEQEAVRAPGYQHSGFDALCMAGESGGGQLQAWQDIDIVPGQPYTASVWVKGHGEFGVADGSPDSAGLWVQELGPGGAVVKDHGKIELKDPTADFVLQKLTFTPTAGTKKVRFMLDTVFSLTWPVERAIFDDCVLDGPAPPTFLTGTVTSGGAPVQGATVEILNRDPNTAGGTVLASAVTDSAGVYRIDDPPTGSLVTVRASKSTHYAQGFGRTLAKGESVVNFSLVAIGNNLLANAGFDDVWSVGWSTAGTGADVMPETQSGVYGPVAYKSGEQAISIASGPGNQDASVSQLAGVQPGSQYTAKVWFRAATNSTATVWGDQNDTQIAGLRVREYDAGGALLLEHPLVKAAENLEQWEQLAYQFTTAPNTAFVTVSGYAFMRDSYWNTLARAVFEDFELNGLPGGGVPMSVSDVRDLEVGATAYVKDQVVSAQFPNHFYIEAADRSAGIRVVGAGVAAGRLATVLGTVQMVEGEKTLVPTQLQTYPGGVRPLPLRITNRAAFAPAGLSPVGLYVVAWGRVDASGGNVFTITDGSPEPLKVYGPAGFEAAPNTYVRVRGALGSELLGEDIVPVLRALEVTQED